MPLSDQENLDSVLGWLLEAEETGVRYQALRDLCGLSENDPELIEAGILAHQTGAIARVLSNMKPEGCWSIPGPGYSPKYRSTVWAIILLAQLGASVHFDERVQTAVNYLLEHAYAKGGYFTHSGKPPGTFDCLQGNLSWALKTLGCKDTRLDEAYEWMARSQIGEGIAPITDRKAPLRYYSMKSGPDFCCGANNKKPCAWGAAKVMLAFSKLLPSEHTSLIERAIQCGVEYFFSTDPAQANWAYQNTISRNWWKFGFPVFYITDLLQVAEGLTGLGYGSDPRMTNLLQLIRDKRNPNGCWMLEYDYAGKTWGSYGKKGLSNKWVTLRALRVLQMADQRGNYPHTEG